MGAIEDVEGVMGAIVEVFAHVQIQENMHGNSTNPELRLQVGGHLFEQDFSLN